MLHPHRVLRPYSAGRKTADLDCAARRAVSSLAATDFVVVDLDGADLGAVGWGGATMEEPELEPELSLATSVLPQLVGGLQELLLAGISGARSCAPPVVGPSAEIAGQTWQAIRLECQPGAT